MVKLNKKEIEFAEGEGMEDFDEAIMPITTGAYLYLSGTPFRAIASGEFIEPLLDLGLPGELFLGRGGASLVGFGAG